MLENNINNSTCVGETEFTAASYTESLCKHYMENAINLFIDVGPGIKKSEAWIVKQMLPNVHIVGFEPQLDRYEDIKETYPGELHQMAVFSYSGKLNGFMGNEGTNSQFYACPHDKDSDNVNPQIVNCVKIDDIFDDLPDYAMAFIWLDAEGSEYEVLRGTVKSLSAQKIWAINVEINFDESKNELSISKWPRWNDIIVLLKRFGFLPFAASSEFARIGQAMYHHPETGEKVERDILTGYNLSEKMNNPHSDILFLYEPLAAAVVPDNFFEVL